MDHLVQLTTYGCCQVNYRTDNMRTQIIVVYLALLNAHGAHKHQHRTGSPITSADLDCKLMLILRGTPNGNGDSLQTSHGGYGGRTELDDAY